MSLIKVKKVAACDHMSDAEWEKCNKWLESHGYKVHDWEEGRWVFSGGKKPNGKEMMSDDEVRRFINNHAGDSAEFKIGQKVRFKAGEYKGKVFRLQEFHGDYARLVSPVGSVSIPKHLLKDEVSVANDSAADANDAACNDSTESSIERKLSATIGGDVTIAGTHIYVDKSVPFDKARTEVEKLARENGASVVKSYKMGFKDVWGFDLSKRIAEDSAADADEFKVGQKVKAKPEAASWTGYQGHALGNRVYTVKKVDADGAVLLSEFLDVFVSAKNLVAADSASGQDAKADFSNRIMPLVRKIADAQKMIEGVLGEAEELEYEAGHGGFPDSTFAKKSANQLGEACYEAVTALRKVKTIAVF